MKTYHTLPDFSFENQLWDKGLDCVAGADEVGRGAFAGPVVAAAVIFPQAVREVLLKNPIVINDSKKLSAKQREDAEGWIKKNAITWGVGEASVIRINKQGIVRATYSGFRRALSNCVKTLTSRVDYLLIDGFKVPYIRNIPTSRQMAIVRGDGLSFSIAAASILAKVYRDKLMRDLGNGDVFRKYFWNNNKGYGTLVHTDAIRQYGPTIHHRQQFVKSYLS